MKVSRHFLVTVFTLFLLAGGVYYFFTKTDQVSAENLGVLDTFLFKNYGLTLDLDKATEERLRIYCDPSVATSTEEDMKIAYPCQNENPVHKIVIGWANSGYDYMTVMKSLGNEQLFWRNYPSIDTEDASITCSERADYTNYHNTVFGLDCVMVTTEKDKLYSSIFFLQGVDKTMTPFIVVMNTVKPSSSQQVEMELLSLVAHLKESPTKYRLDSISVFGGGNRENSTGSASSSSSFSTEANVAARSGSANTITKNSGNGIDATVCDVVDTTSCYPLYCDSITAVWNYSLNKCVEPDVSVASPLTGGAHCGDDAPVWDGSKCRAVTGNVISGDGCSIATGKNSCSVNIFWSTQAPKADVEVRRKVSATESVVIAKGKTDSMKYTLPYQEEPYLLELYDGSTKLNDTTFVTTCAEGGWDKGSGQCVNPRVVKATVSGEYYKSPGALTFTCADATQYTVRYSDTATVVASGTYVGETIAPLMKTGNYAVSCGKGGYDGTPVSRYFNAPPPPPAEIAMLFSPRSVPKNGTTVFNWTIHFPRESCVVSARVLCKNAICNDEQREYENEINQILQSESTDADDPEGSRPIPTAIATVAPSHVDSDWKATGQKTLSIAYTTDFTLKCADGNEQTKRVYLMLNKEQ